MIDWLFNEGGCLSFDRDFHGGRGRLLQCLHDAYILEVLEDPGKMVVRPTVVRNDFLKAFGHYTIKRENSIQMD